MVIWERPVQSYPLEELGTEEPRSVRITLAPRKEGWDQQVAILLAKYLASLCEINSKSAKWLIAAIACDNYAVEVRPSEIAGFRNPFHVVAIPNMGLTLGEIFFLEELAADCAADGRYAFLLVAPPLPVTRAVGTPINPYALK